ASEPGSCYATAAAFRLGRARPWAPRPGGARAGQAIPAGRGAMGSLPAGAHRSRRSPLLTWVRSLLPSIVSASSTTSAGLLLFRKSPAGLEVFLAHPGGPFWRGRDAGAWTIPKGNINSGETALDAARREFEEETGITCIGPYLELGNVKQKGGKVVH